MAATIGSQIPTGGTSQTGLAINSFNQVNIPVQSIDVIADIELIQNVDMWVSSYVLNNSNYFLKFLPIKFRIPQIWQDLAVGYWSMIIDILSGIQNLQFLRRIEYCEADYLLQVQNLLGLFVDTSRLSTNAERNLLSTLGYWYSVSGTEFLSNFMSFVKGVNIQIIPLYTHDDASFSTASLGVNPVDFTVSQVPLVKGFFNITSSQENFIDNGNGTLTGSLGGSGTINYITGFVSLTFHTPPGHGLQIVSNFRTHLYQDFVTEPTVLASPSSYPLTLNGGHWYETCHCYLQYDISVYGNIYQELSTLFYQIAPTVLVLQAPTAVITSTTNPLFVSGYVQEVGIIN